MQVREPAEVRLLMCKSRFFKDLKKRKTEISSEL